MDTVEHSENIDRERRRLFGAAAMTLAAAQFSAATLAGAQPAKNLDPVNRDAHTSLGEIKQIDAGLLNVGYAEAGPADGPVVMLLHGWPYDIHSFVDVAPLLASKGYRVIVPISAATAQQNFSPMKPCAMVSSRWLPSILSI